MNRSLLTRLPHLRLYSTPPPTKPSIKLVAELRKLTQVSLAKAREALSATNNDVQQALEWLQADLSVSGAKKAAKVQDRSANEGLIGYSLLSRGLGGGDSSGMGGGLAGSVRAALVELNCETDFVARNDLFGKLLADIAHTAAFISEQHHQPSSPSPTSSLHPIPLEILQNAPLLSHSSENPSPTPQETVSSAIQSLVSKVGEKIALRRASSVVREPLTLLHTRNEACRVSGYAHGSIGIPTQGRIAALAVLGLKAPGLAVRLSEGGGDGLEGLERALAKQIVGFPTTSVIRPEDGVEEVDEGVLYEQEFMMYPESNGKTVGETLKSWSERSGVDVEVVEFAKWTVGEPI